MRLLAAVLGGLAVWLLVDSWGERRLDPSSVPWPSTFVRRGRSAIDRIVGAVGFGPRARTARARERTTLVQALAALAAELEAGQPPVDALQSAGGTQSVWPSAVAAGRLGGDVAAALRDDARGRPILAQLAACWAVGARTGSGLAASVARLAASSRAAEDVRVQLEAQLAAPRATARMLSLLPVIGIAFGVLLGSDPVGWLLASPIGWTCLIAGVGLTLLGSWWTGRIARRVEVML